MDNTQPTLKSLKLLPEYQKYAEAVRVTDQRIEDHSNPSHPASEVQPQLHHRQVEMDVKAIETAREALANRLLEAGVPKGDQSYMMRLLEREAHEAAAAGMRR